jgi:hypothetical protein
MTSIQFESVSAEILALGNSALAAESVSVEVLAGGTPSLVVGTVSVEVLVPSLLQTGSNVFDHTGTERQVYRWTGTELVLVTFGA